MDIPACVPPGTVFRVRVFIDNTGDKLLDTARNGVQISYRWNEDDREPLRTPFLQPVGPGKQTSVTIAVASPETPGTYTFSPALVIEGVRWMPSTQAPYPITVSQGALHPDDDLNRYEERIFSQNGEDGIIRELLFRIGSPARFIVEIGSGDGSENNSTRLIENAGFSACLIEGDSDNAERLRSRHARRSDVTVISQFVDADSIGSLLRDAGVPKEIDVLSIDVDGNDAAIWKRVSEQLQPRIVIIEYNAARGANVDWVMPYDPHHRWTGDDYFGASIAALERYGIMLGYALIGTESNGVNAFFIRRDLHAAARFPSVSAADAYRPFGGAAALASAPTSSAAIRSAYTRDYYVNDCGGFAGFGGDDPLSIDDPRLRVTAAFGEIRGGRRALDLGCGRGEISAYLAARGWMVDAVDYSADAIALAREHINRTNVPAGRVRLVQSDVGSFQFERAAYDLVIAADVIEHLAEAELDTLYLNVSGSLTPQGILVLHTFPNAWHYNYEYPRRLRSAVARGETLPADPRTDFERLMHINEQSPRTLLHQLRPYFPHVEVWAGNPLDPFASHVGKSSRRALREASDLFAVAGHTKLDDIESSRVFVRADLSAATRSSVRLSTSGAIEDTGHGGFSVLVSVENGSDAVLSSAGSKPVMLAYHWLDATGKTIVFDGHRTSLGPPLRPGETSLCRVKLVDAPVPDAIARITLVQEGVAWFDPDGTFADVQPGLRANAV